MATFGNVSLPSGSTIRTEGEDVENDIWGGVFTMPEDGTADSITVKAKAGSATTPMQCAIYKESDLSYVDETEEKNITANYDGEITFNFSGSPNLSSGVDYILCLWVDSVGGSPDLFCDSTGGDTRRDPAVYSAPNPTWPDPLGSGASIGYNLAIYCTYTPSAAGGISDVHINIGDAWKNVSEAYINIGDAWRIISELYINIGDAWRTLYVT